MSEKPATGARGDGTWVFLSFRESADVTISPGPPGYTIVRMPKLAARAFADQVQEASHVAEPGCKDPDAHWHGHCGCK